VYVKAFLLILGALLCIIYLFDTVELLRRAADSEIASFGSILLMGFFKLPDVGQQLFTFAILFAGMLTFWMLTRRHELVVLRAAGMSAWQFIIPVVLAALAIGLIKIMLINPLSAVFLSKYKSLENIYLDYDSSLISVSKQGLWLKQRGEDETVVIHADKVDAAPFRLHGVMVLFLNDKNDFARRIDASTALLQDGKWEFQNAALNQRGLETRFFNSYNIPTDLTVAQVEESFSSPQTISFWHFPEYIETLRRTGFNAKPFEIYFQSLLAQPLLFMSMILLAASVSLRAPRQKGGFVMIVAGIGIGFLVFFSANFLHALGASDQIPLFIAAWFPALITFIMGIGVLMSLEDG
jgi:lipopolysaccharide export system permease protein